MSTLFLDIDGVLNEREFLLSLPKPHGLLRLEEGWDPAQHIDPKRVAILNTIIASTGCDVVLSSSWREAFGIRDTLKALRARGYEHGLLDGTPRLRGHDRYVELRRWLEQHPSHAEGEFVILDDDEDAGVGFGARFLHCTKGLTAELAERAILMLGRRPVA